MSRAPILHHLTFRPKHRATHRYKEYKHFGIFYSQPVAVCEKRVLPSTCAEDRQHTIHMAFYFSVCSFSKTPKQQIHVIQACAATLKKRFPTSHVSSISKATSHDSPFVLQKSIHFPSGGFCSKYSTHIYRLQNKLFKITCPALPMSDCFEGCAICSFILYEQGKVEKLSKLKHRLLQNQPQSSSLLLPRCEN